MMVCPTRGRYTLGIWLESGIQVSSAEIHKLECKQMTKNWLWRICEA